MKNFLKVLGHRAQQIAIVSAFSVLIMLAVVTDNNVPVWLAIAILLGAWACGYAIYRYSIVIHGYYTITYIYDSQAITSHVPADSPKEAVDKLQAKMGVLDIISIEKTINKKRKS